MRQRVAIAITSLVAAAVLAVGLSAAGFGPVPGAAQDEVADLAATGATVTVAEPGDPAEPEIIYVEPAPQPKTVVVKKRVQQRASNSGSAGSREVRATRSDHDDDDDEHEYERESAKERRESRRESAKERREHEREHEDDDD